MHATKANAWNEERLAVHILHGYTEWAKKNEITKAYLSTMALRDAVFFLPHSSCRFPVYFGATLYNLLSYAQYP